MSLFIRKTKRPKSARTVREKVSAVRRQSTETKLPESALTNDAYVKALILELGELIEDAQREVAVTANAALTTLYWEVGRRVRIEVLEGRRALSPHCGDNCRGVISNSLSISLTN